MDVKKELIELRDKISGIDQQIVPLFLERMLLAQKAGEVKARNNMAIHDPDREQKIVEQALSKTDDSLKGETALLMRTIIALAREYQQKQLMQREAPLLPPAQEPVREHITCAYQGVPGAWSEQALIKLFPDAEKLAVDSFEDVFLSIRDKISNYGVMPIENSTTGAIGETYDLLRKYGCFIVGRTWIEARQCLLAPPGTEPDDIREVFSHPEGFKQCSRFLRGRAWDLTASSNTAVAAEMAARARNGRTAAIGSRRAGELNGLIVLAPDIMDSAENRTSFVVIAPQAEYDENSDLISVTFSTAHRSGALCEALLPFMAMGLNLMKIESRPSTPGKYRFFVELAGNILDENVKNALLYAAAACEYFEVLGCYHNQ